MLSIDSEEKEYFAKAEEDRRKKYEQNNSKKNKKKERGMDKVCIFIKISLLLFYIKVVFSWLFLKFML